jgi:hypothetical protein
MDEAIVSGGRDLSGISARACRMESRLLPKRATRVAERFWNARPTDKG